MKKYLTYLAVFLAVAAFLSALAGIWSFSPDEAERCFEQMTLFVITAILLVIFQS